jgi:hypothetical protein
MDQPLPDSPLLTRCSGHSTEYTANIRYGPGSVFWNFPSSSSSIARSNEGSKQCRLVSTSAANELQDNGEHSGLVRAQKVTTS